MIPKILSNLFNKGRNAYTKGNLKTGIWNAVKPNSFDYAVAGATVGYGMNDSSEDRNAGFISNLGSGVVDGAFGLGVGMAMSGTWNGGKGIYNLGKGLYKAATAGVKATDKV